MFGFAGAAASAAGALAHNMNPIAINAIFRNMAQNAPDINPGSAGATGEASDPATCNPLPPQIVTHRLARLVLAAFVFTFVISRILVILIMSRRIPDMFLHVGRTHVHHLNYGIFLLSATGAYLIFRRPIGKKLSFVAVLYGIGLGLTFDEFGMWIHLGGSYWQRASFDAVVVIAAVLGLIAFAPKLKRFRPQHWITAIVMSVLLIVFGVLLVRSVQRAGRHYMPRLIEIEENGPG